MFPKCLPRTISKFTEQKKENLIDNWHAYIFCLGRKIRNIIQATQWVNYLIMVCSHQHLTEDTIF